MRTLTKTFYENLGGQKKFANATQIQEQMESVVKKMETQVNKFTETNEPTSGELYELTPISVSDVVIDVILMRTVVFQLVPSEKKP
ncbi:MAG: hypothetical protein WCL18_00120 [bacterium]